MKYKERHFVRQTVETPSSQVPQALYSIKNYHRHLAEVIEKVDDLKTSESSLTNQEAQLVAKITYLQAELKEVRRKKTETVDSRVAVEREVNDLCEEMNFQTSTFEKTLKDVQTSILDKTHLELDLKV